MKLKEIKFSDLMIMADGNSYLRHFEGHKGPVVPLPDEFKDEVLSMKIELDKEKENECFAEFNNVPYRVTRILSLKGSGYFLRRPVFPVPDIHTLGLHPIQVDMYSKLYNQQGLVLLAGATGSGKTTTAYSLIQEYVVKHGDIVIAIEDPPELPVQGTYGENDKGLWYQIDVKAVGGFQPAMIAAMRYNPRYIFIGEIRSPEVANEALRAAVNGHIVIATIHSHNVVGAIMALQQLAAAASGSGELARSILADGLLAVAHQKLMADPANPGTRRLVCDSFYIGDKPGVKSNIRCGKLELLSNDIENQRILISKNIKLL